MRTSKERARLIHRRTAEIKQERRIKRQRRLDAACMAACLFLVIGIGALMPGLMRNTADGGIAHPSGTASLLGSHAALGYIIMGAAGVSSWGLRDGSFVPSASEI